MDSRDIDAGMFENFMNAYNSISENKHYAGSVKKLIEADAVVVLGTRLAADNLELFNALKLASDKNDAKVVYAHPIEDVVMKSIATQFMKYEPGSEEGLLALLAYYLLADANVSEDLRIYLNDLDLAYLEAESNTSEEEFEEMIESFKISQNKVLIVGDDVMAHERVQNIAKLCALIENNSEFSLLLAPMREKSLSEIQLSATDAKLEEIEELAEFNGTVIYHSNPIEKGDASLRGSAQFAQAAKISDGDFISISFGGQTVNRKFKLEEDLKGTIALNPTFDIDIDARRYKFERSQINKINQNSESDNE